MLGGEGCKRGNGIESEGEGTDIGADGIIEARGTGEETGDVFVGLVERPGNMFKVVSGGVKGVDTGIGCSKSINEEIDIAPGVNAPFESILRGEETGGGSKRFE